MTNFPVFPFALLWRIESYSGQSESPSKWLLIWLPKPKVLWAPLNEQDYVSWASLLDPCLCNMFLLLQIFSWKSPSAPHESFLYDPRPRVPCHLFCQPPQTTTITHNPQLVTLETPQDYIRLWQRPQDTQSHVYQAVQMSNWVPNEQATVGQATCTQV